MPQPESRSGRHAVEGGSPGNRGINYWESADRSDRRLIFGAGGSLRAIDARTGAPIRTFGVDGRVNMREGTPRPLGGPSGTPGRVFENLFITGSTTGEGYGSPPGDLRAYDIVTRPAGVDVPHDPASRRVRLRHLARRRLEVGRRRQRVGRDLDRRAARHRLLSAWLADARHVRRRPQRREPVRQLAARARCAHRQTAVALPDRASRHLGLRPHHRAEAPHRAPQREDTSTSSRKRRSSACSMSSIASPANRCGRSRSAPCRRATCPGEESWPTQPFPTKPPPFARLTFTADDINPHLDDAERARLARDREERAQRRGVHAADADARSDQRAGRTWRIELGRRVPPIRRPACCSSGPRINRRFTGCGHLGRGGGGGSPAQRGRAVYQQFCESCHGQPEAAGIRTMDRSSVIAVQTLGAERITTRVRDGSGTDAAIRRSRRSRRRSSRRC